MGIKKEGKPEILTKVSTTPENVSKDRYLYVYGITNNKDIKLDFKGLNYQPIQQLELKDITVLFSFYPTLHPIVEEKEALLHAEILNKLAGKITIVPMAFGTVFKDQEILKIVLSKSYPAAKKTLELIKDKMELGIKVIKKEGMLEEANPEILTELNKLSVKSIAGGKFSERLLLNNSFLVEKKNFAQFSDKVGELEQKYPNLKFLYTGPWPAYSFVNINIKAG
ncbi:MAG: GvpL/GvpF family gas vesicle protein [Nanoarchaeota archaeon]